MAQNELYTIREQADFLLEVGRNAEARSTIIKGLSIAPDDYDLICQMSCAFNREDNWKESLAYAQRAISVAPENSWAYILQSSALSHLKRNKEAVKAAQEAVRIDPENSSAWHSLAYSQYYAKNPKDARKAAERMRNMSPEWYLSYQMLTLIALEENKLKDAEENCLRELQLKPDSYFGMNNMGVVMERLGRKKEAIDYYHRAAKINPAGHLARENLKHVIDRYLPKVGLILGGAGYFLLIRIASKDGISLKAFLLFNLFLLPITAFGIYRLWKGYNALTDEQKNFFRAENKRKQRDLLFEMGKNFFRVIQIISVILFGGGILFLVMNLMADFSLKPVIPHIIIIIVSLSAIIGLELLVRLLKRSL